MISGYVSSSVWWVPGTGNANLPTFAYGGSAKADGFNLDVVKLSVERPLDEGQWSAGYKFDALFGPDANVVNRGVSTTSTSALGSSSDFAIRQAYVALRAPAGNGLDLKLGVWDTIIGYETFDAGNNPNYTRSYGYSIEPTTHTGLLASYQASEMLGFAAGIANTLGPTINGRANPPKAESYKAYMGSVAFTAPEAMGFMQGSTLYFGVINGFSQLAGADQTSWYLGGTLATPVKGLKVGASFDYAGVSSQDLKPDSDYANAWAAYLSFAASEKLSLHARAEYASTSVAGLLTPDDLSDPKPGSKVFALTGTLQYDLWKNVLSRFEIRWDHAADGSDPYGGDTAGTGGKKNSFIMAANLIYKF